MTLKGMTRARSTTWNHVARACERLGVGIFRVGGTTAEITVPGHTRGFDAGSPREAWAFLSGYALSLGLDLGIPDRGIGDVGEAALAVLSARNGLT